MDDAARSEAIIARCWKQLDELTATGETVLESGVVIHATDKAAAVYINTLRALARMKPPKGRRIAIPEDFVAPDTRGKGEGGQEAGASPAPFLAPDVAGGEGTQVTAGGGAVSLVPPADRGSNAGTYNTSPSRHSTRRKRA